MMKNIDSWFACILAVIAFVAWASVVTAQRISPKIEVDLEGVNDEGLRGPPTGLRAVHYEFCIPAGQRYAAEVRGIDPTVLLMPASRGRIGCTTRQVLAMGNTHQPSYREVLDRLAALVYIERIVESPFE